MLSLSGRLIFGDIPVVYRWEQTGFGVVAVIGFLYLL